MENNCWRLGAFFWATALLVGLLQTWVLRHSLSPDGMSYLDLGDALWRDGWFKAVNGNWSPLYSWLVGLVFLVVEPSTFLEFTVAHFLGFAIYLVAAVSFDFLLRQWMAFHALRQTRHGTDHEVALPEWAWLALGWAFFIWSSTSMIKVSSVTPDMLNSACVYLASGMILRICLGRDSWLAYVLLGIVLGLSFLARAPMFPLTFVFLGALVFSTDNARRAAPRVLATLAVFLLIAGLQIAALTISKGRLTFSDSGRLNYLWHIDGITLFVHWQGDDPRYGAPAHPTRRIHDQPAVYEFAAPVGGTYPPWYDPSYWNEGAVARFNLEGHLKVLRASALVWWEIISNQQRGLVILLFIPLYLSWHRRGIIGAFLVYRILLTPAIAALVLYTTLNLEPRYVGPFVTLVWLSVLSVIRLPWSAVSGKVITGSSLTMLIVLAMGVMSTLTHDLERGQANAAHVQWQVADALSRMGVKPGDRVALIGDGFRAYWARLAKVRIVAEIASKGPLHEITAGDSENFWKAEAQVKAEVMDGFAQTGAKVVVTDELPDNTGDVGWQRLGSTDFHAWLLAGSSKQE